MPKISAHDLMTISRVLLLIIGQNDINPKMLQPIVASICKVMTVKKPFVFMGSIILETNLNTIVNPILKICNFELHEL